MTRASRIVEKAGLQPGEAILLSKPSNIFYVSGYTGEGIALLAGDLCAIVTDFRYTEQVTRQAPGFEVFEIKTGQSHFALAAEVLAAHGVQAVRFEADEVTVARFDKMKQDMPGFTLTALKGEPEQVRRIKEPEEIACIRKACDISCKALANLLPRLKPGVSETDIRLDLEFEMLRLGGEGLAFNTIVASGPNGSLPHAVPGDREIREGDMVTMDFGARYEGYDADMTRTVAVGRPSDKMRRIYEIVLHAQETAQAAIAPGVPCREIDRIDRDIITEAGYGECFGHSTGHGVGIDIHEDIRLSTRSEQVLAPGNIVTVEPGIYVPGLGGVRIENTCAVTETGVRALCGASKELRIL